VKRFKTVNSLLKKTRRFLKKNRTFLLVNLTLFFSSGQWNLTSWNFKGPRITSKCLWTKVDPILWTTSDLLEVLTSFLAFKEYSKYCAVFQVQKSLKSFILNFSYYFKCRKLLACNERQTSNVERQTSNVVISDFLFDPNQQKTFPRWSPPKFWSFSPYYKVRTSFNVFFLDKLVLRITWHSIYYTFSNELHNLHC